MLARFPALSRSLLFLAAGTSAAAACEPMSVPPPPAEASVAAMQTVTSDDVSEARRLRAASILTRQREAGSAYAVHETRGRLDGRNPAQAFAVSFGRAVQITPDQGDWGLAVRVHGFGCVDDTEPVRPAPPRRTVDRANRVSQDHGPLVAWYLNGPLGLEQGFEVAARPACAARADLRVLIEVDGLTPEAHGPSSVGLRDAHGRDVMRVSELFVTDATGAVLEARMGVDRGRVVIDVEAAQAEFPLTIDPLWSQQAKLLPDDAPLGQGFGFAVDVSGDTAVIGADFDGELFNGAGAAYVFVRQGSAWVQQAKLSASDAAGDDRLGSSVAISGDTVVVGAPNDDDAGNQSGSAYVFVRNGTTWSEQAKLTASDAAGGDFFGIEVTLDGDTVVVGSPLDDHGVVDGGSAYVFVRNGTTWSEQSKLVAGDAAEDAELGWSADLDGDDLVVGASRDDTTVNNAGSAYVFVRSGTMWSEQDKLVPSDPGANDRFGFATAISGDTVVVTANGEDPMALQDAGSAYVFERSGTAWSEQAKLVASDAAAGDIFGTSVGLLGERVVVGAPFDADAGMFSGSAYAFVRNGTAWSEEEKLTAADATADGRFGRSIGTDATTVVLGSPSGMVGGTQAAYVLLVDDTGEPCVESADCLAGFCVDGVCCASACGGGATDDCQACAAALTGQADGVCAPVPAGITCRAATRDCDADEVCDGATLSCPADADAPDGRGCDNGDACTTNDVCVAGVCTPGPDMCGGGGAGGAATPGTGGGAPGGTPAAPEVNGGCTCHLAGAPQRAPLGAVGAGLLGLALLRRRRNTVRGPSSARREA